MKKQCKNSLEEFLKIVDNITPDKNGCKIWPQGLNEFGYGYYYIKPVQRNINKLLYFHHHPDDDQFAQIHHKCKVRACCNIEHLELGMPHRGSKLTKNDVLAIRESFPKSKMVELAKKYQVSPVMVSLIIRRKSWIDV